MFQKLQNLESWQIAAIVIGILVVVYFAYNMMKGKKEEDDKEFKNLRKIIKASSVSRIQRATSGASGQSVSANVEGKSLYNEIGLQMCKKPIDYAKLPELLEKLKSKIDGKAEESLAFIIYNSNLPIEKKKDFITSMFLLDMIEKGSSGVKLLENDQVQCGSYSDRFCNNKAEASVNEFGNNLYNFISALFQEDKLKVSMYNHEKQFSPPETTEEQINKKVEDALNKFSTIKSQVSNTSLCDLY